MLHAARLLGLLDQVRVFKRTVEGAVPVYEEVSDDGASGAGLARRFRSVIVSRQ